MDSRRLFYHPYGFEINSMEKLLLIGFENSTWQGRGWLTQQTTQQAP